MVLPAALTGAAAALARPAPARGTDVRGKMKLLLCVASAALLPNGALALDNGLGRLPPLGWSSWNRWKTSINETVVLDSARALQTTGLLALGFNHVNIDAGYLLHERHPETDRLQVDPAKFPRGMRYVADAVHAMGLKLGVYTDISGHSCTKIGPGSLNHYKLDAETFRDWEVDYLKVDFCGPDCGATAGPGAVAVEATAQYAAWHALGMALNATGRPIYYSICPHTNASGDGVAAAFGHDLIYAPPVSWSAAQRHALANSILVEFRNTFDMWGGGSHGGLITNIDSMVAATHFNYSVPGSWNDADMLWTCSYGGTHPQNHMKMSEYRVHHAVWSIFGSPMILSADLRTVATQYPPGFEGCMSLLLNKAIIDVNQDNATLPARLVSQHASTDPVTSSSITAQVFARNLAGDKIAVLLLNRGSKPVTMNVTWAELQPTPVLPQRATVFDVMQQVAAGSTSGAFSALVPSHDVSYVVLSFGGS
eukprot:SAG31_NODE_4786_length_2956_cov_5.119006_1_plen_481_part_00